jgi:hypothetical protein
MAGKRTAAEECCAKCESDIAVLRKEIAALRVELKKQSSAPGKGGKDSRVDALLTYIKIKDDPGLRGSDKRKKVLELFKKL